MKDDKITSGILGLGGKPVPKTPGDPSTEYDADSVSQRRARLHEGEAEADEAHEDNDRQGSVATGIDMGAGGQGTGVKY